VKGERRRGEEASLAVFRRDVGVDGVGKKDERRKGDAGEGSEDEGIAGVYGRPARRRERRLRRQLLSLTPKS